MYDLTFEASCQLAKTLYAGYDQLAKILFFGGLGRDGVLGQVAQFLSSQELGIFICLPCLSLWFLPNVLETIVLVLGNVKDVPIKNVLWLKLDPCDVYCGLRELCLD